MDLDTLKKLFEGFDLSAFLPEVTTVLGWVEMLLRLAVMAPPLILLGLGLLYMLAPPKEANYKLGYRFWWSMSSLDAWQFTHRLAGYAWSGLGLVLTLIMALICNGFRRMEPMNMVWCAAKCLLWEAGLIAAGTIAIDAAVVTVFDKDGFRRKNTPQ